MLALIFKTVSKLQKNTSGAGDKYLQAAIDPS